MGKPPYNGANHIQLLRNIEASEARLPDHIASRLSAACRGLLGRLLQRNPVERITFDEFFSHPFLTGEGHGGSGWGLGGSLWASVEYLSARVERRGIHNHMAIWRFRRV